MSARHRLTDAFARKLDPTGKDQVYWDLGLPGFGLRLTARGRKRWLVAFRSGGQGRRWYFGDPSIVPARLARSKAKEILAQVALGEDPWAAREQAKREDEEALTLREVVEAWMLDRQSRDKWRPDTIRSVNHAMKHLLDRFGDRGLDEVSRSNLKALHRAMADRPVSANRTIHWTRALYTWAIREELTEKNPAIGIEPYPEHARERVMTPEERSRYWRVVSAMDQPWRGFFRLLLLLGCRQSELWKLRWEKVVREGIQLSARSTKAKQGRLMVLGGPARAEVEALRQIYGSTPYVFGEEIGRDAMRWRWEQICKRANLEDLTPHDLKRSKQTFGVNACGLSQEIVAKAAGNSKEVSAAVYALIQDKTIVEAEEQMQRALVAEAEGEPAEVVAIR